jgi:hypothetical protein
MTIHFRLSRWDCAPSRIAKLLSRNQPFDRQCESDDSPDDDSSLRVFVGLTGDDADRVFHCSKKSRRFVTTDFVRSSIKFRKQGRYF